MTLPKPATANPSLLHESTMADHSACLKRHSAHNSDIHPAPEICNPTIVLENRPFSNRPSQQRLPAQHKAVQTRSQTVIEPPTLGNVQEERSMTPESLQRFLTIELMRGLHLRTGSLEYLWSASLDPPITKASLSELELARIINDARLRHDLNFEREVSFRPNMCGDRGKRKKLEADAYWEALVIEFAVYIRRQQSQLSDSLISGLPATSPWLHRSSSLLGVPLRLPRMFKAVQEILKTLVPGSEWPIVDERLDIDLLLQQLEKGVCDIPTLIEWLGALLLCCCSPQRDPLVTGMVSRIRRGFENDNPRLLVKGLKDLFGVLELMKLVSFFSRNQCDETNIFVGCRKPPNKIPTLAHGRRYHSLRAKDLLTGDIERIRLNKCTRLVSSCRARNWNTSASTLRVSVCVYKRHY